MGAHVFTTGEYLRMVDTGALEGVPVELLGGQLVDMRPQSPEHAAAVRALLRWFAPRADVLSVQMPLVAAEGWVPEPDVALGEVPQHGHPRTAWLAVEVVVTQHAEAERKLPGYALAGVERVWVVDVLERSVTVHGTPSGDRFEHKATLRGDDLLDPGVEGLGPRSVDDLLRR